DLGNWYRKTWGVSIGRLGEFAGRGIGRLGELVSEDLGSSIGRLGEFTTPTCVLEALPLPYPRPLVVDHQLSRYEL
ncbi:MAG: hypothetical protein NZ846_09975, partial [Thermus sp.]|uniref:hypothetical protein n=1 Tax=Thermus sp. TaxID=275 RepID=UPI0025F19A0B